MKKLTALLLLASLLLLLPSAANAAGRESAHTNYITDVFNEDTGLPTGEANAVVQGADGYLWIGSYGGLIRYDGSIFTDYSSRLASSAIRALFVSSDGALWIGTNDAGAGNSHMDLTVGLTNAVESACHEGIVLNGIAENHQLCSADTVTVSSSLSGLLNDLTHKSNGVHVDTGLS